MTRKLSKIHSHENTSDKARHGRTGLTPARRMRRIIAAALVPAAAAVTLLSSAGIASAATTPLSSWPTSECYANGTVVADRPSGQQQRAVGHLDPLAGDLERQPVGPRGHRAAQTGLEPGPNGGNFGTWMNVNSIPFRALPDHYYAVVDPVSTVNGGWQYYTSPLRDRASSYYCYTN